MTFEEELNERYKKAKLLFCKYTSFKSDEVIDANKFDFNDWNQFRRVCYLTGLTEEGMLKALEKIIKQ